MAWAGNIAAVPAEWFYSHEEDMMRSRNKFLWRHPLVSPLLAAAVAGIGCTATTVHAPHDLRLPVVPVEEKMPLRLGLYMQSQVREHTTKGSGVNLKLGGSLGEGVEALMRSVFSDVMLLSAPPGDAAREGMDAVMVVEVLGSDCSPASLIKPTVYYTVGPSEATTAAIGRSRPDLR